MFDSGLLVLVQVDLDQARAVQLDTDALAHNLRREAQVLQDIVVHHGQGTAANTKGVIFTMCFLGVPTYNSILFQRELENLQQQNYFLGPF